MTMTTLRTQLRALEPQEAEVVEHQASAGTWFMALLALLLELDTPQ